MCWPGLETSLLLAVAGKLCGPIFWFCARSYGSCDACIRILLPPGGYPALPTAQLVEALQRAMN